MPVLYLVRHAQASFGAAVYDALSPLGPEQSAVVGRALAARKLRENHLAHAFAHLMNIHVADDMRMTVRFEQPVDERLQPVIGGLFGGIVGGAGGGIGGGMALPLSIAVTHQPIVGFGAFVATALAAYATARAVFRKVRSGRERDLRRLVDDLGAQIMSG